MEQWDCISYPLCTHPVLPSRLPKTILLLFRRKIPLNVAVCVMYNIYIQPASDFNNYVNNMNNILCVCIITMVGWFFCYIFVVFSFCMCTYFSSSDVDARPILQCLRQCHGAHVSSRDYTFWAKYRYFECTENNIFLSHLQYLSLLMFVFFFWMIVQFWNRLHLFIMAVL